MKKNPKIIAGVAVMAVMLAAGGILLARMIPTIREVRREMSLTPTPLPAMPDTVRARNVLPDAPTPEPALSTGSHGDKVTALQTRLRDLGYYQGEIDGQFGPGTREAVIAFQRQNGLDADGLAGEETQRVLFSDRAIPRNAEE